MDKCSIQESLKMGIHEVDNKSVRAEQCRLFNHAALSGDLDTIIGMMANGYPTDTADEIGSTVLHFAAQGGHVNVVRKIVENRCVADVDVVNNDGCSPLHVAAAYGRLRVVRMLLSLKAKSLLVTGNNVNISIRKTFYHVNDVIVSRIRGGTSAGMVLCSGSTVLHCAAQGGSPAVIKELVKTFKYDVNATADNGCSPLHIAAALGMTKVVMELIQQGANISLNVPMYGTPLHQAALYGHRDVVRLLLGELNTVDAIGCSALHYAAEGGHVEVIRELVNVGGNIHAAKKDTGSTPLHVAAYFGKKDAVFELIRLGSPVCLPSGRSGTPLHQAALGGHLDILRALINEGCSINAVSSEGFSVLHSAVSGGCLEVISELVKQGYSSTILDAYMGNSTPCVQEKLSPLETSIVTGQGCKLEDICDVLGLVKSTAAQECMPYSLLSLLFSRGLLVQERLLHLAAIPGDFHFLVKYFDSENAAQCIGSKSYSVKAFRYVASSLLPSSFPLPDTGTLTPLHISIFSANGIKTGNYRIHANSQFSNHNHFIRELVSHPVLKGTINMLLPTGHTALDLAKHFGLNDIISILKSAGARPGVLNKIPPELRITYSNQLTTLSCSFVSLFECEQGQQVAKLLYTGFQKHYQQSCCNFSLDSRPELDVLDDHVIPRVAAESCRVAIHLGVKDYIFNIIEKDHDRYGCEKVCLNIFKRWLMRDKGTGDKERTWRTVLSVVEKLCGTQCVEEIKEDIRQVSNLLL